MDLPCPQRSGLAVMIKNKRKLNEFYRKLIEEGDISHKEALRIYEALHKEAVALGAISHENIWDGFEAVLRIARAINKVGT